MIVSHTHRFIFIKTRKTAGTSLEIALSRYCGDEDLITPIWWEDEEIRARTGGKGPANYEIPFYKYGPKDWGRLLVRGRRHRFFNHDGISIARRYLPRKILNSYYKFCFERNPWDKTMSWFFYKNRGGGKGGTALNEFLREGQDALPSDFERYSIRNRFAVDRVYQYADLDQALEDLANLLGIAGKLELPRAKGSFRTEKKPYTDYFDSESRNIVAKRFRREIDAFGYEYGK